MKLADLQSQFEAALRGQKDPARILSEIVPAGRLTAQGALDVYGKSYRARLTSALGEIYETVWRALGDDLFFETAARYIAEHPSTTHSLQFYGSEFAVFLSGELSRARSDLPDFLPDLARFEWLFAALFHRQMQIGLSKADLAEALESGAALTLVESAFLFHSPFAVQALFANRASEHLPEHLEKPCWLIVHKADDSIAVEPVSEGAYRLLLDVSQGRSVHDALEASEMDETEVRTLFAHISASGLLKRA